MKHYMIFIGSNFTVEFSLPELISSSQPPFNQRPSTGEWKKTFGHYEATPPTCPWSSDAWWKTFDTFIYYIYELHGIVIELLSITHNYQPLKTSYSVMKYSVY
jgi:hypothetical protein